MVPYCYQCAPSAQPAILSIANAYIVLWAVTAAILPGGMALPQAHSVPSGRQGAALYGWKDARRCVVAVTRFKAGRDRSEKLLETMGAMMHCPRASGGKSASYRVPNVRLSPDAVSECDYSESY